MGRIPAVETPPTGLSKPLLAIWKFALADMRETGVWAPVLRPMLDEMVNCYRLGAQHRAVAEGTVQVIHHRAQDGKEAWDEELPAGFQRNMDSGLTSQHKGFDSALRHFGDARALADLLGLTPKAKKQLALLASEDDAPKEDSAFSQADQLAARRAARAA